MVRFFVLISDTLLSSPLSCNGGVSTPSFLILFTGPPSIQSGLNRFPRS